MIMRSNKPACLLRPPGAESSAVFRMDLVLTTLGSRKVKAPRF